MMAMSDRTEPVSIVSELSSDFLAYSTAIFNRALPDIVDGLKVAQRRVLLGMWDLNLSSTDRYIKVSRLDGTVLSKYHPHGSSASVAITMGQHSSMRHVLSDIHGNAGGSIQVGEFVGQMVSEDPPAAARYLEIRSTPFSDQVYLGQVRPGIGPWRDNYDGTCQEPVRVVPALPALLLTGSVGIASGYACSHVPWNLRDVVSATTAWIRNPKITDTALAAKFTNPPEPPAGGRVVRDEGVRAALLTGRGQITAYGTWETDDRLAWGKRSVRPALIVTRLASGSSEKFLERVRDLADADKLPGLLDAADHSSRDGIRIVLVTKTVEDRDRLLGVLVHNGTGLKHVHSVNATAVGCDGKPCTVGVREAIRAWHEARVTYLAESHQAEADRLRTDLDRLSATLAVLTDLDKFLKTVRTAKDKPDAVAKVARMWKLTPELARYVVGVPVSALINTEREDIVQRHADLSARIAGLELLSRPGPELNDHICTEIASLRGLCGPARSVWMTGEVPTQEAVSRPFTDRERMAEEAKALGIGTRTFNQWVRDNTGTGKLAERWAEYKLDHVHRLQMTTRDGKKQRKEELARIRSEMEGRGLPKRGQYAWNAFMDKYGTCRIDVVRANIDGWIESLPRASANPNQSKSKPARAGGGGGVKKARRK